MALLNDVRRLFANAEVSLVGARDDRVEAEAALANADYFRARAAAQRILERAPRSPIALGLLADACEGAGLDAELEEALLALSKLAAVSPDVWLRLGQVRARVHASTQEIREAYMRTLAWSDSSEPEAQLCVRQARLALVDIDLEERNFSRAEGWLAPIYDNEPDVLKRKLAIAVAKHLRDETSQILTVLKLEVTNTKEQFLYAQALALVGSMSQAIQAAVRAVILSDAQEEPILAFFRELLVRASQLDAQTIQVVESLIQTLNLLSSSVWQAALASAQNQPKKAAQSLCEALTSLPALLSQSERSAARTLALAARNIDLFALLLEPNLERTVDHVLIQAVRACEQKDPVVLEQSLTSLTVLKQQEEVSLEAWLKDTIADIVNAFVPHEQSAVWPVIMRRLGHYARLLFDLNALEAIGYLAIEQTRPIRIAIVGEFNAGKSTFINALLGIDAAPTGIVPTTAVTHTLRFGPDPIARVFLKNQTLRTVVPERLKGLLKELETQVERVEVEMPFAYLQQVEIVDTPGFNAPDPEHAKIAMASLIDGAGVDLAVWIFDANQPLKISERRVLEAIHAHTIPIQALLNKSDRLSPEELQKVLITFKQDFESIGLHSWREPVAFSARQAIDAQKARAVDSSDENSIKLSIETNSFEVVRALLEDEVVANSLQLKERGLRRRAHDIAFSMHKKLNDINQQFLIRKTENDSLQKLWVRTALLLEQAAMHKARVTEPSSNQAILDRCQRAVRDEIHNSLEQVHKERQELLIKENALVKSYLQKRLIEVVEHAFARAMIAAINIAQSNHALDSQVLFDEIWHSAQIEARAFAVLGSAMLSDTQPHQVSIQRATEDELTQICLWAAAKQVQRYVHHFTNEDHYDALHLHELTCWQKALKSTF